MTAAEIESLRIANQGSRVAEAAQSAEMAGALPAEARTAAQAVEEANALKLAQAPSEAQKVQAAADMRQAQEANRLATVGKATQNVGQAAASSAAIDTALGQPAAATAGGIPDLNRAQEDFRRAEIEQQNAAAQPSLAPDAAVTAATTSAEKPSWLTNDRALNMGLQMMAGSGKPGSGSALRDLMQSAGAAGIGTLAQEREERKLKSTELENLARTETLKGQGRKFGAEADILASGLKGSVQAATLAQTRMKDFTSTMQGKLADEATRTRIYNQFLMDAYNSLGIPPPTAAPAATPAARTGWGTATTG